MAAEPDFNDLVHDAINDFFSQVFGVAQAGFTRFTTNFYNSFAQVSSTRWTKVIGSVVFYIIIRPYIERFFRWSSDRERKNREEKEKKQAEATGYSEGKKAKVSANSLRSGKPAAAAAEEEGGKVLGEVENTDDEVDDDEEGEAVRFAKESGVPEWGKNVRRRQKKQPSHNLSEEQLLEMLDWSEDEGQGEKK